MPSTSSLAVRIPDHILKLNSYVPGKPIEETRREYKLERVVKLASNENPLGPSPMALSAINDVMKDAHRYPEGEQSLKESLAGHLSISPASLIIGNGSTELIDTLIRAFCEPGDSVVTSQGAFIAYRIFALAHRMNLLESPLTDDLRFDLPAMAEQIERDTRARLVFIANPNNPTGTYVSSSELQTFLERVAAIPDRSVLVVLDYAYWEYVTAADFPDAIELMRRFRNVVVLRTFSKLHGLAGFRVGYAVAAEEIISCLKKVSLPFNVNSLAPIAARAALADSQFIARARAMNIQGLHFWESELTRLGVPFQPSQANFILIDVKAGFGLSGPEIYESCLRHGVIFRPVTNYGMPNALRITIGTPEENSFALDILQKLF